MSTVKGCISFLAGHHPRCGAHSIVSILPLDIPRMIICSLDEEVSELMWMVSDYSPADRIAKNESKEDGTYSLWAPTGPCIPYPYDILTRVVHHGVLRYVVSYRRGMYYADELDEPYDTITIWPTSLSISDSIVDACCTDPILLPWLHRDENGNLPENDESHNLVQRCLIIGDCVVTGNRYYDYTFLPLSNRNDTWMPEGQNCGEDGCAELMVIASSLISHSEARSSTDRACRKTTPDGSTDCANRRALMYRIELNLPEDDDGIHRVGVEIVDAALSDRPTLNTMMRQSMAVSDEWNGVRFIDTIHFLDPFLHQLKLIPSWTTNPFIRVLSMRLSF